MTQCVLLWNHTVKVGEEVAALPAPASQVSSSLGLLLRLYLLLLPNFRGWT